MTDYYTDIYLVGYRGYIGSHLLMDLRDCCGVNVIKIGREDDFGILKNVKPDSVLINCAGYGMKPNDTNPQSYLAENILLPNKLAKLTAFYNIKMIHLSSYFEHFHSSIYSKSKAFCTELLKPYRHITIAYLGNVFGGIEYPNRIMGGIKKAIETNTVFTLYTPKAKRDFIHIDHVIQAIIDLVSKSSNQLSNHLSNNLSNQPSNIYQLGTGKPLTMLHLCECIKTIYPKFKLEIRENPKYNQECHIFDNPYFHNINLYSDIYKDINLTEELMKPNIKTCVYSGLSRI